MTQSKEDSGAQSIGRAVDVLTIVAQRRAEGVRLSDVATQAGLHIATARRTLQALVARGLLFFDTRSKLYAIGPAILAIAISGNPWFSRREAFVPVLDAVAERTRDTVMFSVRSGHEAVCLERREGAFPIRVMSLEKGSRRPLGAGSGSLAILAFLDDADRDAAVRASQATYASLGLSADIVEADAAMTRRQGFSVNPGRMIPGVYGVGVPILSGGVAVAAVSVAAIESRMGEARQREIASIIGEELMALEGIELPAISHPRSEMAA